MKTLYGNKAFRNVTYRMKLSYIELASLIDSMYHLNVYLMYLVTFLKVVQNILA